MAAVNGQHSLELKRQAVAYFNENRVPEHVEALLNDMFKEKPQDIFGYMSEFFGKISKPPSISKITCREVLSSRGFPTVQLNLYCTIKGLSKLVTSMVVPYDASPEPIRSKTPEPLKAKSPDPAKQAKTQTADSQPSVAPSETDIKLHKLDADDLIDRVAETLAPELDGIDPLDQKNVDKILMSLVEEIRPASRPLSVQDEVDQQSEKPADDSGKRSGLSKKSAGIGKKPSGMIDKKGAANKESTMQLAPDMEEEMINTDYAILGVSMVMLEAAATLKACPVFEHLKSLTSNQEQSEFTMPIPAMTLLTSGKYAAGKQNLIKEVLVLPKPGVTMDKGVQQLTDIFHKMGTVLSQKMSPMAKCVTEDGSYSPAFDKPEMALDNVVEAINACGYALGADVDIILNCAASELYDKDKQKYEVILNTFKTLDDVINMYSEFLDKYPGIIGIIDAVRSQDKEGWIKLNQRIGEKCFVIGNDLYKRNSRILPTGMTDKLSSAALLSLDQANTVTELLEKILHVKDQNGLLVLSEGAVKDTGTLIADLAVSAGARFIKLGGPTRIENVTKYRRLCQIEQELEQSSRLVQQEPHVYPVVNIVEENTDINGQENPA
ncbi:hypothetical protein QZH41_009129 [Actinostola sp. cb2023]|nr:hypothetical protein QZH41_009129 [Actinostola sp. cb2023]